MLAGFLLALVAGGLGGARALAPWWPLIRLLPPRTRAVFLGSVGALAVLVGPVPSWPGRPWAPWAPSVGGRALDPGAVGAVLLLLVQVGYVPNAVVWAICYALGPGFAFGIGTVVAPTGSALGSLPMLPMLSALPSGAHSAVPGWASLAMLAVPTWRGRSAGC